ncbi:MAG: DUF4142 domain-containing protein [Acidobacteriaceae bacterium]
MVALIAACVGSSGAQTGSASNNQQGMASANGGDSASSAGSEIGNSGQVMLDRMFVRHVERRGLAQVQLGQLAMQKSNNAAVKAFAQRMVDDHARMNEQFARIAKSMELDVPQTLSRKKQALFARLQALSGSDFDKEYVKLMLQDHRHAEMAFLRESQNATSPQLKTIAAQAEEMVHEHKLMAENLAKTENIAMK